MREFFKRLRPRNYTWSAIIALVGIAWPLLEIFFPPNFLAVNVDPLILGLGMWVAIVGAIVQIFGYLSSFQPGVLGVLGVSIELVGLILSTIAPLTYLTTYVVSLLYSPLYAPGFYPLAVLVAAVLMIYVHRIMLVVPRFRLEAHDPTKE